ncbi:serine proteinase 1 [Penaeus vannamei]|uniref:Serine proteinase 1 n=1 Tax=Penaeus vannamei TaxID=6689 RepID=A0A423TBK5_PENVA|nr:serine proteinase 1 [Penaeus vannamei]
MMTVSDSPESERIVLTSSQSRPAATPGYTENPSTHKKNNPPLYSSFHPVMRRNSATTLPMWAAAILCLAGVMGGPNRVRRQAVVDTSHISDNEFLCLLEGNCNANPPPPSSGCTCVKWWNCKDVPRGNEGGILAVVDVRIEAACPNDASAICCDNVMEAPPPTERPTVQPARITDCGRRNEQGVVVNFKGFTDRQAQFGEFPWMAAVLRRGRPNLPEYVCGGSLVHPRVILTVAHHVRNVSGSFVLFSLSYGGSRRGNLIVRLGEWDFQNPSEAIPHQDIRVSRIIIHPQYTPGDQYNALLLLLADEAQLGSTVSTICLPPRRPSPSFDGARCFSSGWGKTLRRGTVPAGRWVFAGFGILKSIDLPMVRHDQCERALKTSPRLSPNFFLHPSFVCAGGEPNKDVCTGDGGSPLVCPMPGDPSRYVQVGVVAWGLGCGQAGMPGVYASVSQASEWIMNTIQQNTGFDLRLGK